MTLESYHLFLFKNLLIRLPSAVSAHAFIESFQQIFLLCCQLLGYLHDQGHEMVAAHILIAQRGHAFAPEPHPGVRLGTGLYVIENLTVNGIDLYLAAQGRSCLGYSFPVS